MDKYLFKFIKFAGEEYLRGPNIGKKFPDTWAWVSWKHGADNYSILTFGPDGMSRQQFTTAELFESKNSFFAKASEIPRKFLHAIIGWEFRE